MTAAPDRSSLWRREIGVAAATLVALAILITLGDWQLRRREWKAGILADIDRAEHAPPIPLRGEPPRFTKVLALGTLMPDQALYGSFVRDITPGHSVLGADRLQILRRAGEPPLLVDLGWVPTEHPTAADPPPAGSVSITGYVRPAEHPGLFSAEDDPANKRFFTLNPAVIGPALGAPNAAPFTLIAMADPPPAEPPIPATALPRPPNDHLQYAFTWFGLALALIAVTSARWLSLWRSSHRATAP
jgi:surfeit locus 1 family protein